MFVVQINILLKRLLFTVGCITIAIGCLSVSAYAKPLAATNSLTRAAPAWIHTARLGTPHNYPDIDGWDEEGWKRAVDRLVADGVNVILGSNCVSADWRCLEGPKLASAIIELKAHAEYIHTKHPGVHYIIYMAPLEMVTEGIDIDLNGLVDADKTELSLVEQHPEWAQMGIDGRRASFFGSLPEMPFWVCSTCEDVWMSPAHPEYRQLTLNQVASLASTGIDGIWFDAPFLTHEFGDGWLNQWSDVSPAAQTLFQQQTGLTLPIPPIIPNWSDPVWQTFIAWRYRLIREFVADYYAAMQSVNPDIQLIMETSTRLNASSTQTGASPLDFPGVSSLTVHEHFGTARPVHYYRWLKFLAEMVAWRHIDIKHQQPSWLFTYVTAGHPDTLQVARLQAATALMSGVNYFTSGDEGLHGVVDMDFRKQLFSWINTHESTLYDNNTESKPYANLAVVYSQQTLDYRDRGDWTADYFTSAFTGMEMLLLESHIPYEVISERNFDQLHNYDAVILPHVGALTNTQVETLRQYVAQGGTLISTGETSLFQEQGMQRSNYALADVFAVDIDNVDSSQIYSNKFGLGLSVFAPSTYEAEYYWAANGDTPNPTEAELNRLAFIEKVWNVANISPVLVTDAPRSVILLPWSKGSDIEIRAVNFTGIGIDDAIPTHQEISLTLRLPNDSTHAAVRQLSIFNDWSSPTTILPTLRQLPLTMSLNLGKIAQISTAPKYDLGNNQWHQISVPANLGNNNTVEKVFADDISGIYGTDWILYSYDTANNRYHQRLLTDILEQGTGYWIVQLTGNTIQLDLPENIIPSKILEPEECPFIYQCFEIALPTRVDKNQWMMLGHPFSVPIDWNRSRVVTDSGVCSDAGGCSLSEAESLAIFHNQLWHYNGNSYDVIDGNQPLIPWHGYWGTTLNKAHGLHPRLFIPVE